MKKLLFILLLPYLAYAQTNTTPQFKRNVPADSLLGYSIPGITGNHWLPDTAWVKHHVSGGGGGGGTTINPLTVNNSGTGDASPFTFNGSAAKTLSYNSIGAQAALGFTPENVSNKATDFSTLNNTLYPTTQAVQNLFNTATNVYNSDGTTTGVRTVTIGANQFEITGTGVDFALLPDATTPFVTLQALTTTGAGNFTLEGNQVDINFANQSTGKTSGINFSNTNMLITDDINDKGLTYTNNYGANFTARSLVDRGWVDSAKANLVSPALTGIPTAPTAALGTNTTQLATTAFVLANASGGTGTVTSITPGVGFLSHTPITSSGTMNVDTLSTIRSVANSYSLAGMQTKLNNYVLSSALLNHVAGYGLSGSNYNTSVSQTWTADTTSAGGLVSKSRLATNLGGYLKTATASSTYVPYTGATTNVDLGANTITATKYLTGTLTYTGTNILASFQSSVNAFNQLIVQNSNSGAAASSDVVVNNDQSTNTTFYGDFGMNSSGFTGSGAFNAPNNVFLTSTSADIAIGTTTPNGIHFVVNGGATDALAISSTGAITGTGVASAATASKLVLRDANANTALNALIQNGQSIATAAGVTTLTVSSPYETDFTGTTTQTVALPVVSTLVLYQKFFIQNGSTGSVTVQSSGGNGVQVMVAGSYATFTCIAITGTGAASWNVAYVPSGSGAFMDLTTNQTAAGNKTFTGTITQNNTGNFIANGISSIATLNGTAANLASWSYNYFGDVQPDVTLAGLLFGGASKVAVQVASTGAFNNQNIGSSNNYGHVIIGTGTAQTGVVVPWGAQLVINKLNTVTFFSVGALTNTAGIYINGQSTQGTNNYNFVSYSPGSTTTNIWAKYGTTRVSGLRVDSLLTGTGGTDNILVDHGSGAVGSIAANSYAKSPNGTINILASTQTTLVAGTKAISVTGVTTGSHAYVTVVSQGGTVVAGTYSTVCTSGTVTITAKDVTNATNTLDTSVLNVFVTD